VTRSAKVAVIQATPVVGEFELTLKSLEDQCREAAHQGVQLVVLPEAFIGGYPKGMDFGVKVGMRSDLGRDEFRVYFERAIEVPGPATDGIAEVAKNTRLFIVVGVVERDGGTLYCTALFFGPEGTLLGKHRKLMPTAMERVVWGFGDGSTLPVIETSIGKVGAVICWENYMPLLRTAMYAKGVEIYCAITVDDRDSWIPTVRHIAMEGRCFVLSACQFLPAGESPTDQPGIRGGSCIVSPFGELLTGPVYGREAILIADIDLDEIVRGKFDLDVVGHYARPDIFQLHVNEEPQKVVTQVPIRPKPVESA